MAGCSWGSPVSGTDCTRTRDSRWSASRVSTAGRDSWRRSTRRPARRLWDFDVTGPGWEGEYRARDARWRTAQPGHSARTDRGGAASRRVALRRRFDLRLAGGGHRARSCSSSAPATRRPRWPMHPGPATTSTRRRWWRSICARASASGTTSRCPTTAGATTSPARRCWWTSMTRGRASRRWRKLRRPVGSTCTTGGTAAALQVGRRSCPQRNLFTPPRPGDGVSSRRASPAAPTGRRPLTTRTRGLFFVAALHLPTRYVAHEAKRPDGSVLQYASTQNTEEAWGTLTAVDLANGGRLRWQVKDRRAADRRRPRDRRRTGVLRRRQGRVRRLRVGERSPPLVLAVRRRGQRSAGYLLGGWAAVRGGRGRRQRALRLHPGRHGDGVRPAGAIVAMGLEAEDATDGVEGCHRSEPDRPDRDPRRRSRPRRQVLRRHPGLRLLFRAPPGSGLLRLRRRAADAEPSGGRRTRRPRRVWCTTWSTDIHAAYRALLDRGVAFLDQPHCVARLPDHDLWMTARP